MSADGSSTGRRRGADVLADAVRELALGGIPTAAGDAEIILAHTLGLTREDVASGLADEIELTGAQRDQVAGFVERRKDREPLQHLTGVAFFRQLRLAVGPGVFVPRRETEFVAQLAIDALRQAPTPSPVAVDLGTGAGAIALSMAVEVPHATVYGVELYPDAFAWTRRNVEAIAPGNAHAVLGDLADALPELDGRVDVVAGNPPFTPDGQHPVTPEVRMWDPPTAWAGGKDGFDLVRALSRTARRLLRPGGTLAFEHGVSQAPAVAALLAEDGWDGVLAHRDPRSRERVTTARR